MQSTRHPMLQRLDALVGEWEIEVTIDGQTMASSRTSFRWMDGEPFLIQRSGGGSGLQHHDNEWVENAPDGMTMVIGPDDTHERYSALYADTRGVFRVYQMSLNDGVWKLWREAPGFSQRFTGRISNDGNTIESTWEASEDGDTWDVDFNLKYRKIPE